MKKCLKITKTQLFVQVRIKIHRFNASIGEFMMKTARASALIICILLLAVAAEGQNPPQPAATIIRGSILDAADLQSIPNVNIYVRHGYGTASNENGYFELPCHSGDTINFSCVGYQRVTFAVPDSLIGRSRVVGILMSADTVLLGEVVVLPFITYAQLKYEVSNMPPDENISLAINNIDNAVKLAISAPHPILDAELGPMRQLASYTRRLEYAGMYEPQITLNLVGSGSGLASYVRMLKKSKTQPSVSYNYNNAVWQRQMADDVRRFVGKSKTTDDGHQTTDGGE